MGDISGKMVSQYTTSNLTGMGVGMILSKFFLNVGEASELIPVFLVLSTFSTYFNYLSVKIIDEAFLNRVRASILVEEFIKNNRVMSKHETNQNEKFWLPNFINPQYTKWISFGKTNLTDEIKSP